MLQPTFEGVKRRQEVLLSCARPKQQGGELLDEAVEKSDQEFAEEARSEATAKKIQSKDGTGAAPFSG